MALPLYLAMTAAEIAGNSHLPPRCAYLACHFSPWSQGLSNCPEALSPGTMLILDDSAPIQGHDPRLVASQLSQLAEIHSCSSILLDFQRSPSEESQSFVRQVLPSLPCAAGVSELYAAGMDCPVFLSPVPLDVPLQDYLAPWNGREIWLDAAVDSGEITVDKDGYRYTPLSPCIPPEACHRDQKLHCRYQIQLTQDQARFTLHRTREDLDALLTEAEKLGVTTAVGLWQELK